MTIYPIKLIFISKNKKNRMKKLILPALIAVSFYHWQCSTIRQAFMPDITQDVALGKQTDDEIRSKPGEYPLLPEQSNKEVYSYVRNITQKILNSGNVQHAKDFAWEVKIINDPKTLNAFCTPGGYIYVYTGLIKYLDSEDQLAGVMGHEIAHADKRHSMQQMVDLYGVQLIAAVAAGAATAKKDTNTQNTAQQIAQMGAAVIGLKFSRNHETEADNMSVAYLCGTDYNSSGAAGFFKKIGNQGGTPEFLSTHPSPPNRVQNIEAQAAAKNCPGHSTNEGQYQRIKSLLR
jgi:beta-barrel assembly-enhancing protease